MPSNSCCDNQMHNLWRLWLASHANEQSDSPLFRLPAEVRNQIYAYAMTSDIGSDTVVHLAKTASSAPSKSLLTTCARIYFEVREMYSSAQREFWSSHVFAIELDLGDNVSKLPRLRKVVVDLIPIVVVWIKLKKSMHGFHFFDEDQTGRWTISSASETCSIFEFLLMKRSQVPGLTKWESLDEILCQCARILRTRMRLRQ